MFGRTRFCLLAILLSSIAANLIGQAKVGTESPLVRHPDFYSMLPEMNSADMVRSAPFPPQLPLPVHGVFGFPQFSRAAGMIFSGTVRKVERRAAARGQPVEAVAITFHVERAIRGATLGEDITISQWLGLWSSGQRYRVGERVLLFLYPPSKLGLTSCVGGQMGRFAIDPGGHVLLTAQHLAAFQRDPVLGGRSRARVSDFALAVQRAGEEQ
jgi:hypothetical protein